jgi:hypothetical protein
MWTYKITHTVFLKGWYFKNRDRIAIRLPFHENDMGTSCFPWYGDFLFPRLLNNSHKSYLSTEVCSIVQYSFELCSCCWSRDWLLYPNYNYLSWGWAAVFLASLSHLSSALLFHQVHCPPCFHQIINMLEKKHFCSVILWQNLFKYDLSI